jgi:hypothetical protein
VTGDVFRAFYIQVNPCSGKTTVSMPCDIYALTLPSLNGIITQDASSTHAHFQGRGTKPVFFIYSSPDAARLCDASGAIEEGAPIAGHGGEGN